MFRKALVIWSSLAVAGSIAVAADVTPAGAKLSATDIADKNVAARGGLQAWRAVQTMTLAGKLGAGGNQRATLQMPAPPQVVSAAANSAQKPSQQAISGTTRPVEEVQLPFLMELERPRKMRFELQFNGQTAIQVFDGANGWKLRPFLGRRVVEPYTPDEMKTTSTQADLDGPLVDYAAKGTTIELAGVEKVEDRDTYKLKLTMKNGAAVHVWIDAQTFLEAKIQGQPRLLDGVDHPVEVYFRDYRPVNGLQIPFVLETRVLPVAHTAQGFRDPPVPPERTIIDKVVVNPKLDDSLFSKPEVGLASNAR
jgi:outer membrane lipoprotein-sorting protein